MQKSSFSADSAAFHQGQTQICLLYGLKGNRIHLIIFGLEMLPKGLPVSGRVTRSKFSLDLACRWKNFPTLPLKGVQGSCSPHATRTGQLILSSIFSGRGPGSPVKTLPEINQNLGCLEMLAKTSSNPQCHQEAG